MLLERFVTDEGAREGASLALRVMAEMYPLCRSITGEGVRRTLDMVEQLVPLERHEVPSGTQVFDWEVPREWNIRDAYIADHSGRRVVDFREHNLHVVNYSTPVRTTVTLEELQPHLHSIPEHPDWIPYRTTYYREQWGFCLRHRDRERLAPGSYDVVIDSTVAPGHLTYAECVIAGHTAGEAIVYTHTCHPSLANDNLTGIAVAAVLARTLRKTRPRLTWRFVFGPGTIGSLTWLSRNETRLPQVVGGWVVGLLGDAGPLTYKRSRQGKSVADRCAEYVLRSAGILSRCVDFEPYGYDERQFCSPGFDLPIGRLTRSPDRSYPEYHTSGDDLSIVRPSSLVESLQVLARMISILDTNCRPISLNPKGEPRLGKRGLYSSIGGTAPGQFQHALFWVLSLADGAHDLIAIAERSGLDFELVQRAVEALVEAGLVDLPPAGTISRRGALS